VTNRPQMIRTIVADKTTAIFTAQAVSSALYAAKKPGRAIISRWRCSMP